MPFETLPNGTFWINPANSDDDTFSLDIDSAMVVINDTDFAVHLIGTDGSAAWGIFPRPEELVTTVE